MCAKPNVAPIPSATFLFIAHIMLLNMDGFEVNLSFATSEGMVIKYTGTLWLIKNKKYNPLLKDSRQEIEARVLALLEFVQMKSLKAHAAWVDKFMERRFLCTGTVLFDKKLTWNNAGTVEEILRIVHDVEGKIRRFSSDQYLACLRFTLFFSRCTFMGNTY